MSIVLEAIHIRANTVLVPFTGIQDEFSLLLAIALIVINSNIYSYENLNLQIFLIGRFQWLFELL
ncbi:hypothetical protein C0081_04245 [Cohaesibacter celericrescens]|uniref:Uncharacterized protein n=1 Tax=Cohaesibacter celericrescens TaxID=2067669 RepID=A0A2N5XVC8_9HYPH|nr:hypothetical protein C0081_04245 [Cohaesibacter celericrescens]